MTRATSQTSIRRASGRSHGRGWAYAGLIFGSTGSITANVGHAFLRPEHAPAGWKVEPGAIAWGVAVAVALLISVEVLARTEWPTTLGWRLVRYAGGSTVALVAAGTSYRHLSDLLRVWHETTPVVYGGPAIVDGLMILCSFALMIPTGTNQAASGEGSPTTTPAAPEHASSTNQIGDSTGSPILAGSIPGDAVEAIDPNDRLPEPARSRPDHTQPPGHRSPRRPADRGPAPRSDRPAPLVRVRPDDLRRAARAVEAGDLPANPTASAIRVHLGISPAYARATRDALAEQPPATKPSPYSTASATPEDPESVTEKPEQEAITEPSASSTTEQDLNHQPITSGIN